MLHMNSIHAGKRTPGIGTGEFLANYVNTMVTVTMARRVAKTSVAKVLIIQDKRVLVFHRE